MKQVYKSQGYQVVATRWTVEQMGGVSFHPMPNVPATQTRYRAKKFVAALRRSHGSEWINARRVGASRWRSF